MHFFRLIKNQLFIATAFLPFFLQAFLSITYLHYSSLCTMFRGVARGGAGGARADQLTLFKPWGADYARHTTASPPGFKMLCTPLQMSHKRPSKITNALYFDLENSL